MKIAGLAIISLALTGCSAKHYAVCMAVGQDSGCSHKHFTKQTAATIGALMASQPGSDERTVWIEDTRKHGKDMPAPKIAPQENNDNKL